MKCIEQQMKRQIINNEKNKIKIKKKRIRNLIILNKYYMKF